MLKQRTLSLDEALAVVNGVIGHAKANNHRGVAVVVTDKYGEILASARMSGLSARVLKAAHRKCYTAAVMERDTSMMAEFLTRQESRGHRALHDWNDPMLTTLPGGYTVVQGDHVVGAVAVAGGDQQISDWQFADIAFSALGEGFTHRPGPAHAAAHPDPVEGRAEAR
jgi:uncharacterized protein GlcG (DUF336 family)